MQTTPDDINSDVDAYLERHPLTGGCPYDTTTATHNRHRVELRQHHYAADNNPTWSVCCLTCGAESPPENTYWDAIHVFNSRDGRPLPIVKPAPVMVPLGPEDVPPFCAVRFKLADAPDKWWNCLSSAISGVTVCGSSKAIVCISWDRLQLEFEINRSIPLTGRWDANAWEKCKKPEVQP